MLNALYDREVIFFGNNDGLSAIDQTQLPEGIRLACYHPKTTAEIIGQLSGSTATKPLLLLASHYLTEGDSLVSEASEFGDVVVIVQANEESVVSAALAQGAIDYLVAPFDTALLAAIILRIQQPANSNLVLSSPLGKRTFNLAHRIAQVDATVLLQGESGVGKEVMARYIHDNSARSSQPFVAVNCAAIPESMAEAILFGHVKGAFTGAAEAHSGKFEEANGGTLFLDEISELPLPIQAKLLRVIQEREVERIGSHRAIQLDLRILTAANVSLADSVKNKTFRSDLYYRLAVLELEIPALRDRNLDIAPLARVFLDQVGGQHCELAEPFIQGLQGYDWPGNIRELQNVIQRAYTFRSSNRLDVGDLQVAGINADLNADAQKVDTVRALHQPSDDQALSGISSIRRRSEFELVLKVLREVNGVRKLAAERLGISTRALRYKLKAMKTEGIDIDTFIREVA